MKGIAGLSVVLVLLCGCREGGTEKRFYDTDALEALGSLFNSQLEDLNSALSTVKQFEERAYHIPTGSPIALWDSLQKKESMDAAHQAAMDELEGPVNEARNAHADALTAENEHSGVLYMTRDARPKACGDDGCGDLCGTCGEGQFCHDGICRKLQECAARTCGTDSVNGSCGSCDGGQYCDKAGACVDRAVPEEECEPQCQVASSWKRQKKATQEKDYSVAPREDRIQRIPSREGLQGYLESVETEIARVNQTVKELYQLPTLIAAELSEVTRLDLNILTSKEAYNSGKTQLKLMKAAQKSMAKLAKKDPSQASALVEKELEVSTFKAKLNGEMKEEINQLIAERKTRMKNVKALESRVVKKAKLEVSLKSDLAHLGDMKRRIANHLEAWSKAAALTEVKAKALASAETKRDAAKATATAAYEAACKEWNQAHGALAASVITEEEELTYPRYDRVNHDVSHPAYSNGPALKAGIERAMTNRREALAMTRADLDKASKAPESISGKEDAAKEGADAPDVEKGDETEEGGAVLSTSQMQAMIDTLNSEIQTLSDLSDFLTVLESAEERAYGLRLALIEQREIHIP